MSVIDALNKARRIAEKDDKYHIRQDGKNWEYYVGEPRLLWTIIEDILYDDAEGEYIWRGQADARWSLKTTLQRFYETQGLNDIDSQISGEKAAVAAFLQIVRSFPEYQYHLERQRGAGQFTDSELLVMMRHYGCPSRFLDWTLSPYVALFFAATEIRDCGALFGLNLTRYLRLVKDKYNKMIQDNHPISGVPCDFDKEKFWEHIRKKTKLPALLHSDVTLGRAFNQQSIFMVDIDLSSHETDKAIWEALGDECEGCFFKLVFPRDGQFRERLNKELFSMNIDGYHLYEGLMGASFYAMPFLAGLKPFGHSIG